ncbi:MAG: hypothetical protein ACK4F9_06945 [Brevinematia bacterium]
MKKVALCLILISISIVAPSQNFGENNTETNNQIYNLLTIISNLDTHQIKPYFILSNTNILTPLDLKETKSLKVSFDFDEELKIKDEPFFMSYERRYEIIFLVSIPTTYMVTKFLMEQVSLYNYKDITRTLNTQQWAFIILSSIIIPFIVATEDYINYKKFVEEKLKF